MANVDKPNVAVADLGYRVGEFGKVAGEGTRLICTAEPTFEGKARVLRELGVERVTFVVGSDTYVRVVSDKYYDSREHMMEVLEGWRRDGVRFVVCPRGDVTENEYEDDRGLSTWLTKEQFWNDVSSTDIREGRMDRGGNRR